jgi:hypothetical protein
MFIRNLTYDEMYLKGMKQKESKFWSLIGFPFCIKSKLSRQIAIWDLPWECKFACISETFACFLLTLAIIHFIIMKVIGRASEPLLKMRMLSILERLPIVGRQYRKMQQEVSKNDDDGAGNFCGTLGNCNNIEFIESNTDFKEYMEMLQQQVINMSGVKKSMAKTILPID